MSAKKKRPAKKTNGRDPELAQVVVESIKTVATEIKGTIDRIDTPELTFPIRSLKNVRYDPKVGYLEMQGQTSTRTLTVNTVKSFAQTLRMMSLSKLLVDREDVAVARVVRGLDAVHDLDLDRARERLSPGGHRIGVYE